MNVLPLLLPLLPLAAAPLVLLRHRLLPRSAPWLAAAASAAALAVAVLLAAPAAAGLPITLDLPWSAPLGPDLYLRADAWGVLFSIVISAIGSAVCLYAGAYHRGEAGLGSLLAHLLAFQGAMLLLATADDPLLLFTAWELTSFLSYRLVASSGSTPANLAARDALLITGLGGLALLAGLLITANLTGNWRISDWGTAGEALRSAGLFAPALLLCVAGCVTKSAQFPFHFWLPGAMAAPTPVSTYLHAATMVKAGIFLLARLHPAFGASALWELLLGGLAAATIAAAGLRLWTAYDLKRLLALSTVLALGTLTALLALDARDGILAAAVVLVAHAGYKATLFLSVGAIDHGAGTRDVRLLGGLRRSMPWTATAALLGAASMAGLPLFVGFTAKEQIKLVAGEATWGIGIVLLGASVLFVAVAWKVAIRPFFGASGPASADAHEDRALALPALATGVAGLLLGLGGTAWLLPLMQQAAVDLGGRESPALLTAAPTAWSKAGIVAIVLACGALLGWGAPYLARLSGAVPERSAERLWRWALGLLGHVGHGVARAMQGGDLRVYIALVLLTVVGLAVLWSGAVPRHWVAPDWHGTPLWTWLLVVLILCGAVVTAAAGTRMVAVAGLGAVGWAVALLFVGFGAPDLGMTQVLVETLSVILLVLAFRRLPDFTARIAQPPSHSTALRAAVAVGIGIVAGGGAWLAQGAFVVPPPVEQFMTRAPAEGFGGNVVNVIIVDLRALDTLGEIAVLGIAAIGAVALLGSGALPRLDAGRVLPRTPILTAATRLLWPLSAVFAAFLYWRGHHEPGGGFAAGLVLAAGWTLVALAHGPARARRVLPLSPGRLVGLGLVLAAVAGLPGLLLEGIFLAPQWGMILGVKLGTPLLFDLGVAVLVMGVVVAIVERLLVDDDAAVSSGHAASTESPPCKF